MIRDMQILNASEIRDVQAIAMKTQQRGGAIGQLQLVLQRQTTDAQLQQHDDELQKPNVFNLADLEIVFSCWCGLYHFCEADAAIPNSGTDLGTVARMSSISDGQLRRRRVTHCCQSFIFRSSSFPCADD